MICRISYPSRGMGRILAWWIEAFALFKANENYKSGEDGMKVWKQWKHLGTIAYKMTNAGRKWFNLLAPIYKWNILEHITAASEISNAYSLGRDKFCMLRRYYFA